MTEEERQRERLAARLKEYRKLLNLSQKELADKLGKAQTVVSSWEIGTGVPSANQLPAIAKAKEQGIWAFGAYAADGFFGSGMFRHFDAVLAMYHDQGLIPFKTLDMSGVNFTAGLNIVRTSPDHGTGYDIAGKNQADERSMRNALFMAIDVLRQRAEYDELTADPLPFIERVDAEGKPRREFIDFKTTKYNDSTTNS